MINTMSKIRGQEKGPGYPQAESVLGDAMQKFGRELGDESSFGNTHTHTQSVSKISTVFTLHLSFLSVPHSLRLSITPSLLCSPFRCGSDRCR